MNEQKYNEPNKNPVAERNRLNGVKSHGPTTEAGRLRTDLSKVTHGIRCERPVIPGVEQPEDWETHYASLRAALGPGGDFEELLVYRIALNFWRLGRVIRSENAAIQESTERVPEKLREGEAKLSRAKERLRLFDWWASSTRETPIDEESAELILDWLTDRYGIDDELDEKELISAQRSSRWTCGQVRQEFERIAAPDPVPIEQVIQEVRETLQREILQASHDQARLLREAELGNAQRLVPYEDDLNRFMIYERQLESSIRSNLHELQRLQAARGGQVVPAPLAVDLSVTTNKPDCLG